MKNTKKIIILCAFLICSMNYIPRTRLIRVISLSEGCPTIFCS